MESQGTVTVYWAPLTAPGIQTSINLALTPPVPLRKLLPTSKTNLDGYRQCPASTGMWANTYALLHPFTSTVNVVGPIDNPVILDTDNGRWVGQPNGLDGYRVDYDYSWIFFCEEDLYIQQTPPFMHNTSDRDGGRIAAGAYNIARWFRPINISYLMWSNSSSITVTQNEPASYVQFHTEKKVILKQFEPNPELFSIVKQVNNHKEVFPLEPLAKLYHRFTRSNRDKLVLKLIKDNLLE
jgi:hypothetical protein